MDKIKLSDIRAKFPQYADLGDDQLLSGVRKKFYPDIPPQTFYNMVEYDNNRYDPTEGMSTLEKLAAGAGKSFHDLWRSGKRVANMAGIGDYDQAAAAEDERLDQPLMNTGAGRTGKFVGDVALTAVPGLGIQRAATGALQGGNLLVRTLAPYAGAATAGAATGAAMSPDNMSRGAAFGAAGGAAGEVGGRVLTGLYGAAKAAVEPLWQSGRERILRRTLERFATDPRAAVAAAQAPRQLVPGYTPTLAEATMDPGLAQLQRSAQTMPGVASEMAAARTQRLDAYRNALDDLAGTDGRRAAFQEAREATAQQQYGRAYARGFEGMTPELEATFGRLMQRPSIQQAMVQARQMAREADIDLGEEGSVAGMHWIKKALDDQIGAAVTSGNNTLAQALRNTQDELIAALQQASPAYGQAMGTYAHMSRPINQMAVGERLRNAMFPPINDASEHAFRANANNYTKALRDGDATARAATGMRTTLEGTLDPTQLQTVRGIADDVTRSARAQELAAIPGSQTAQHLGARNVLRGLLGPMGMPESMLDTTVARIAAGVLSLPFRLTQSQTEELLAQALRNPQVAARLMQTPDPRTIAQLLQPYAAQLGIQATTE